MKTSTTIVEEDVFRARREIGVWSGQRRPAIIKREIILVQALLKIRENLINNSLEMIAINKVFAELGYISLSLSPHQKSKLSSSNWMTRPPPKLKKKLLNER